MEFREKRWKERKHSNQQNEKVKVSKRRLELRIKKKLKMLNRRKCKTGWLSAQLSKRLKSRRTAGKKKQKGRKYFNKQKAEG